MSRSAVFVGRRRLNLGTCRPDSGIERLLWVGLEATPTGLAGGTHHVGQNLGQLDVHLQRLMHALHPARLLGAQHLALTDHGAHHARRCRAATRRAAIPGSSPFATTGRRPRRSCARARTSSAAYGIAPRETGARQPTPDFLPDAGVVDHASIIELDPQPAVPRFVSDGAQIPRADAFQSMADLPLPVRFGQLHPVCAGACVRLEAGVLPGFESASKMTGWTQSLSRNAAVAKARPPGRAAAEDEVLSREGSAQPRAPAPRLRVDAITITAVQHFSDSLAFRNRSVATEGLAGDAPRRSARQCPTRSGMSKSGAPSRGASLDDWRLQC